MDCSRSVDKMRLIDADKVEIGFDELRKSPYFKSDVNARHGAETLMDLCIRTDSHKLNTIDPETLPIVRKLRKELEHERNKVVKIQYDCNEYTIKQLCDRLRAAEAERDALKMNPPVHVDSDSFGLALQLAEAKAKLATLRPDVHGEWLEQNGYITTADGSIPIYPCSSCGEDIAVADFDNFCPNCGARMKEEPSNE